MLVVANLTVTVGRFVALRSWVFATGRGAGRTGIEQAEVPEVVR